MTTNMEDQKKDHRSSVIITCRNYGRYLNQCIESAIAQSVTPKEIIVINDSSEDDTERIALGFGDKIKYYFVPFKNSQKARNFGLERSSGEFVVHIDADDYFHPDFLRVTQEELINDPGLALVYTDTINIVEEGVKSKLRFSKERVSMEFDYEKLKKDNYIHLVSLIRKNVFEGFDENIRRFQDWDAWLTLLKGKKAKRLGMFLSYHRIHGKNKTLMVDRNIERLRVRLKHGFEQMSQKEILDFCGNIVRKKDREIARQAELVHKKENELRLMRSSKLWRLRGLYANIRARLSGHRK